MPNGNSGADKNLFSREKISKRIRQARLRAGLNLDEVAHSLGLSTETMNQIEAGKQDITLPQLEVLALVFNMSVADFWSEEVEINPPPSPTLPMISLRRRIIGVLLRQARVEAGLSEEDVGSIINVPATQITAYELGKGEIPLPQLATLADRLKLPITHFLDNAVALTDEEMSRQLSVIEELVNFSQLPQDARAFLANPANLLYLNIAMRLSELSVETLRGLAEGLLEVTY